MGKRKKKRLDQLEISTIRERKDSIPNKFKERERAMVRRDRLLFAAAFAGISLTVYGLYDDKEEESSAVQTPETQSLSFNPETYEPPEEGRIWKKAVADPSKKTVIMVPDIHVQMDSAPDTPEQRRAIAVQQEIFSIIEDSIGKYGKVPVVLEEWTDYGKGDEYNFKQHIQGNGLSPVDSEKEQGNRKILAQELIRRGLSRSPSLLPVVYKEGLVPVPSHDRKQLIESTFAASYFFSMGSSLEGNTSCEDLGSESKRGILDVLRIEEKSPEDLNCYCTFDALFRDSSEKFTRNRSIITPQEEAHRAVKTEGPFAFIISGTAHTSEVMETLKKENVNFLVVAPRSNPMNETALHDFQPTPAACIEWEREHNQELQASLDAFRRQFRQRAIGIVNDTEVSK